MPPAPPLPLNVPEARPALDGLFGAGAGAAFLRAHWPERHHAVHRTHAALPAALRVPARASLDTLAACYRGPVTFGRGAHEARTAKGDLDAAHLFRLGLSVYLPDVDACIPALRPWLGALEGDLGQLLDLLARAGYLRRLPSPALAGTA